MEIEGGEGQRLVHLSEEAGEDYAEIFVYTKRWHGERQAHEYADFLDTVMTDLAEGKLRGISVQDFPLMSYLAQWRSKGHGHFIIYEDTRDRLNVVRILHSAMDWHGRF